MAAGAMPDLPQLPDQSTPQLPTAPPQAQASQSQPATPGAGATPPLTQAAQGGIAQGTGQQKGEIKTPDVELKFDKPDKLAKAQTTLDLLNAATAKSRTQYMDWWEKNHGEINDRYDHLKTSIGARPSDDEPQSKKEKFAALLEFGLHLMKNSAPASRNQGAVLTSTLSDEHDAMQKQHQANIEGKQAAYDAQDSAIEKGRQEELKGIGTPAAAMKASSDETAKDSSGVKDQATALKDINDVETTKASALGPTTYLQDPKGGIHYSVRDDYGKVHFEPAPGIDGKPMVGKVLGRASGSGVDKGGDPAAVRTYKYATSVVGIDPNMAAPILGVKPTGKPTADHLSIYNKILGNLKDDPDAVEKAKRIADQYVIDNYGAGAVASANQKPVPGDAPPAQALVGLKPGDGKMLDFGAQGKWTLGIDGKPRRVSGSPQTIQ